MKQKIKRTKKAKGSIVSILSLLSIFFVTLLGLKDTYLMVFAHSYPLSVTYDACSPNIYGDGENEKWYELIWHGPDNYNFYSHLPHPGLPVCHNHFLD